MQIAGIETGTGFRADDKGPRITSTSPATGEVLGRVPACVHEDVLIAVERARAAQTHWAKTSFAERAERMLRVADLIFERADAIADLIYKENGKPRTEALIAEVTPSVYAVQHIAKHAERMLRDQPIHMFLWRLMGKRSFLTYKPLGVVGIISPWNYPWGIPVGQIATALMAGNAVVLKPSSATPLIAEKIREVFEAADLPRDVFLVTQGPGRIGEALIEAQVDHLIFTGSVEVGRHVGQLAAKHFIPTTLELGGKDPMIVLEDADLDVAAAGAVWGAFANSGQTCASIERVYAVESVYDRFVEKVVEKTRTLRQGPDTGFNVDVGAMTNLGQLENVEQHVKDALDKGARALTGGKRREDLPGNYYPPTVLVDVDHSMDVMTEETFGPVLPIQKVKGEHEAIRLANDSRFGLTASVWTLDARRGERVAREIVTGTVTLNDSLFTHGAAETPWGGVKESGLGRTHGELGLRALVRPLHISVDSFPRMKKMWWYPYNEKLYKAMKNFTATFTRMTLSGKSGNLFHLARSFAPKEKL
jgi:succinate-semialdehyde dehydrogenase/glutarate-semialdehyde dehydrogenase